MTAVDCGGAAAHWCLASNEQTCSRHDEHGDPRPDRWHQPTCPCGWRGAASFDPATAALNQRVHEERCAGGQGVLL